MGYRSTVIETRFKEGEGGVGEGRTTVVPHRVYLIVNNRVCYKQGVSDVPTHVD